MGNISSLPICPEEFLKKFTDDLDFKMVLNKGTMYTSVLAELKDEGLIVCKMRYDDIEDQAKNNIMERNEMNRRLKDFKSMVCTQLHPNILPIEVFESLKDGVSMAFRQYVCHNLRDRLAHVPKIEVIQKKWITFQLIQAVKQLQNLGEFHGNITPDNILLTSTDWVLLTDCEDDHQINAAYFGDFLNKKRCYIAPERFLTDKMKKPKTDLEKYFAMDIFSLG